ncbi:MAG: quinone-dependent dihydroorotate dehydrogenase [Bacteroidota bacterium]
MYKILLKILFLMPAETAHYFSLNTYRILCKIPFVRNICSAIFRVKNPVQFLGLNFYNPVGLAAGFDKNAKYLKELSSLGFGFVEIGTVTPLPQSGNDLPRLFRLPQDECIINRMGFNNDGLEVIKQRLVNRPADLIVGGNIGKNKVTPNENAKDDYVKCFVGLYPLVDYFVVNVSSPNTPNLRELQDKKPLSEILMALIEERQTFIKEGQKQKPILLKIAPDLTLSQLDDVIEIVQITGIDGLVATNTTISREDLITDKGEVEAIGAGGLSGKILSEKSTEIVAYIQQKSNGQIPIIGVGGIHSVETAKQKLAAGAGLIQLYTGFIYGGPQLVKKLAKFSK